MPGFEHAGEDIRAGLFLLADLAFALSRQDLFTGNDRGFGQSPDDQRIDHGTAAYQRTQTGGAVEQCGHLLGSIKHNEDYARHSGILCPSGMSREHHNARACAPPPAAGCNALVAIRNHMLAKIALSDGCVPIKEDDR